MHLKFPTLNLKPQTCLPERHASNIKQTTYILHPISCILLLITYFSLLTSCGIYSFSGTSIPPDVKTFSVSEFNNQADIVVPTLSQTFTNALRDKFNTETNLTLIKADGDLSFDGVITGYRVTNVAPTGNETAALNRLTITVRVDFKNTKSEKGEEWTESFSRFADYPGTVNLSSVEGQLIDEIIDQIIQDIFNKAAVNW